MKPTEKKRLRHPEWIRSRLPGSENAGRVRSALSSGCLNTICEEARCPNRGECWDAGTATFLILGSLCTRNCRYCSVSHGIPTPADTNEASRVLDASIELDCRYVVITSVTRDDLPDGGATQFIEIVEKFRSAEKPIKTELLVPDFGGDSGAMISVAESRPNVLGHNLEVVERLFPALRPQGDYSRSLSLMETVKKNSSAPPLKSGIMVGLGETRSEISQALKDLHSVGVDIITVGQYLQPTRECVPVERYVHPGEFEEIRCEALDAGFTAAMCGPLVRSSYHAEEASESIKKIFSDKIDTD